MGIMRATAILVMLLAGCMAGPSDPGTVPADGDGTTTDSSDSSVGVPAPAYVASNLDGEEVALSDFRGDVVLLHVWATWCTICKAEYPEIQAMQDQWNTQGFEVVAVSIDAHGRGDHVRQTAEERDYNFTVLWDPDDNVRPAFDVRYQPNSILISREGNIVKTWHGRIPGGASGAEDLIEQEVNRHNA